jgi:hypothetical protein
LVQVGDQIMDLAARTVSDDVHLTPIEWHLLELLVRNPGKLVTQRRILTQVWGDSPSRRCSRRIASNNSTFDLTEPALPHAVDNATTFAGRSAADTASPPGRQS